MPEEVAWNSRVGLIDFATNVLVAVENFRDLAHLYFVHPHSIEPTTPVVEPLMPRRDGPVVEAERRLKAAGDSFYFADAAVNFRSIAPHIASAIMEGEDTEQKVLLMAFVSPKSLEETRVFYVVAATPDFSRDLDELLAVEKVIFEEDKVILDDLEPRRLGNPLDQVHTVADRYTLKYRQAFADFIQQGSDEWTSEVSRDAGGVVVSREGDAR